MNKENYKNYTMPCLTGKGAIDGIHWFIRQTYQDSEPLPSRELDKNEWIKRAEALTTQTMKKAATTRALD